MNARTWLGYDWFKLVIAALLLALLLLLGRTGGVASVAAPVPAATTAAATAAVIGDSAPAPTAEATADSVTAPTAAASADSAPATTPATEPVRAPALTAPLSGAPLSAGPITLTGTGTPGSQVEVLLDGTPVGRATVGADGTWSLDISIDAGTHAVAVRPLDATGQSASAATAVQLDVSPATAVAPPASGSPAASITFPADGAQLDAGPFTMTGTGEPGSAVEILSGGTVLGTATVAADGTWRFPVTPSSGSTSYSVRPVGSASVSGTPVDVSVGASPAACVDLAVACDAWVTRERGLRLRLRDAASAQGRILAMLAPGARVTLQEGPQPANGFTWWRVRTEDGNEGWVAGEELRTQPD
jgi:hypothetical protein